MEILALASGAQGLKEELLEHGMQARGAGLVLAGNTPPLLALSAHLLEPLDNSNPRFDNGYNGDRIPYRPLPSPRHANGRLRRPP